MGTLSSNGRLALAAGCLGAVATAAWAKNWTTWDAPAPLTSINTTFVEGCPSLGPEGDTLYFASNRTGTLGGLDIWVSHRNAAGDWATPVNLGAPINSTADDFCPTPVPGHRLFFVSKRAPAPDGDIYLARYGKDGWQSPSRLGSNINSTAEEHSPSYFEDDQGVPVLYFSSTRSGRPQIFYSVNWGSAALAPGGVNSSAADARPNVSKDGLEIVWDSNRSGSLGLDIWTASRTSTDDPWGTAVQLGNGINTAAGEGRAAMSRDGSLLVFHRNPGPVGVTDIFMATRNKVTGSSD